VEHTRVCLGANRLLLSVVHSAVLDRRFLRRSEAELTSGWGAETDVAEVVVTIAGVLAVLVKKPGTERRD